MSGNTTGEFASALTSFSGYKPTSANYAGHKGIVKSITSESCRI